MIARARLEVPRPKPRSHDRGHAVVDASVTVHALFTITLLRQRHLRPVHQVSKQVARLGFAQGGEQAVWHQREWRWLDRLDLAAIEDKGLGLGLKGQRAVGRARTRPLSARPSFMATTTIRKSALTEALGSTGFRAGSRGCPGRRR